MITFKAFVLVTVGYINGYSGGGSGQYTTNSVSATFSQPMTKSSCENLQRTLSAMGMQAKKNVQSRCIELEFVKGN